MAKHFPLIRVGCKANLTQTALPVLPNVTRQIRIGLTIDGLKRQGFLPFLKDRYNQLSQLVYAQSNCPHYTLIWCHFESSGSGSDLSHYVSHCWGHGRSPSSGINKCP